MNSTHELTVLEQIDQLMGYARNQRDEYLMKYGHDPKYHLGYIAALKVIRQHITTKPVEQSPPLVILGQGDYKTIITEDDLK